MATVVMNPPTGADSASATKRRGSVASLAIHTSLGSCDVLNMSGITDIAVKPPAGVTAVTVYAAETADGTFVLVDTAGTNGVIAVVASKWNVLAGLAPFAFIKLLATGATGTCAVIGK